MTRTRHALPIVLSLSAAALAPAQDLGVKAPPQERPVAIVNATIHPISGASFVGYIAFDHGIITDVGPGERRFQGHEVLDRRGMHVYPGMIGAHTIAGLTEISSVRATLDHAEVGDFTPEVRAVVAVNPDSTLLPVIRTNGVLICGVFPTGGIIAGQPTAIHLDGWTYEEMTVSPSLGIALAWPSARPFGRWAAGPSEEEQARTLSRRMEQINSAFDTAAAYDAARRADPLHATDLRWEAMRRVLPGAGEDQSRVFISAQELDQINSAVAWAGERGLKAVIVGGRDAPLCADLLRKHDVPVLVQGTHNFPKRADSPYDDAFTLPARLEAAGVRWCLASGHETSNERNLPYVAATAVAYGLGRDTAMRAITLSAAEVLGIADKVGSLEKGKHATLFITPGDPLEVTTNPTDAFIAGRRIDLSNKQTILAEKYREKYRRQR